MTPDRLPARRKSDWLENTETEVSDIALPQLLEEAFSALKTELEQNGSSREFIRIRKEYGDKLKAWWQNKRLAYERGQKTPDEQITVDLGEDYDRDDEKILTITHTTPLAESEINVTASDDFGLDTFLNPPKITCQARAEVDGDEKYYWEVIFRGPAISTITKTTVHDHPNHELPYVKQTEILDASSFGIDHLSYSQPRH